MSWKVNRYRKQPFGGKSGRPSVSHRTNDQQAIVRLLTKKNELAIIFKTASVSRILKIALRVKRAKRRDDALLVDDSIRMRAPHRPSKDRKGSERNFHHLTPKMREGQPYYGGYAHNKLLIVIARHQAIHNEFGVRTWEEIILLLSRCVAIHHQTNLDQLVSMTQPTSANRTCRKRARRILRDHFNNCDPGIFRGHLLFRSVCAR